MLGLFLATVAVAGAVSAVLLFVSLWLLRDSRRALRRTDAFLAAIGEDCPGYEEEAPVCQGHEDLYGPAGTSAYCDGSCQKILRRGAL